LVGEEVILQERERERDGSLSLRSFVKERQEARWIYNLHQEAHSTDVL